MYRVLRKHRLILVCLALAAGAIMLLWFRPRPLESDFYGVQIRGDKAFIEQVERLATAASREVAGCVQAYSAICAANRAEQPLGNACVR